jgi:hypothetical protein
MIAIDYGPGTHGNFLEYVVHNYILNANLTVENLFQQSGAAHNIYACDHYQKNKTILSSHYSYFKWKYPQNIDKIICIKHDPGLDFVLMVNTYYRCHPEGLNGIDSGIDKITQYHLDSIKVMDLTVKNLRAAWFARLQEQHQVKAMATRNDTALPRFEFDFSSFYCLEKFIEQLQQLSDFLNFTFVYNPTLVELHQKFISVNQGFERYNNATRIVNAILRNLSEDIDQTDWQLQSYINHRLSKLFKIYDGVLHDSDQYPSNTQEIHALVLDFVSQYDDRIW